ncbi:MAG TPA: DUF3987 domain-containing protein [Azohydromonas sp.]|nr:DUF3987 domain-containing protein [Azohydromonas sp.]
MAKTNDPATWSTFEAAAAVAPEHDGIGLVLAEDLVGIDLDHVLDPETGVIEAWATEVLQKFAGCYAERSPSGDGLRIFCRGVARRCGKGGPSNRLEVYDKTSPRYLTYTGHRLGGGEVVEAQDALDWLHDTFMQKAAPKAEKAPTGASGGLTDEEVLRRAREARNGAKFTRLWSGDAGEDPSSADAALVGILAFWTQDRAQLDRLFRRSMLMRPKWDDPRGETTYGWLTIDSVLAMGGERYSGQGAGSGGATSREAPKATPLPPELAPVEAFPMDALPASFKPWVDDVCERMQCPPDFVAVPLLVAAASLAARRVVVRLRKLDDWSEPANLWALIVGRPGMMKSPAMRAALAPIERLEARAVETYNEAMAQHKLDLVSAKVLADVRMSEAKKALKADIAADVSSLLAAASDEPAAPKRGRYVVNSPTWEKLHELLAEGDGALLMTRDEMSGWFFEMAREENSETRSFFVQCWSGGKFTADRIGRGTITAEDMRLSIIGAIQPGPLGHIMRASRAGRGDDGLIERFLVAWPDDPGPWRDVDRLPDSEARSRVREVFDRLDAASLWSLKAEQNMIGTEPVGLPFLRLDDEARAAFSEWRAELEHRLRAPGEDPCEAALAKFRHHVPAFALTVHLCDGGAGPVTQKAMLRALALGDYFDSHARRLHASGHRAAVRAARLIVDKVKTGALAEPFSARDVYRPQWSGLTEREAVAEALDMLAAHGWVTEATVESGGRPTTVYTLAEEVRRGEVD